MPKEPFRYTSLAEAGARAAALGVSLPLSEETALLREPLEVAGYRLHNRLVIQPMEGCDGTLDGSPGELTRRRYRRFAESGAGLIWMEAVAVVREGRANPRQLMLTRTNLDAFKRLTEDIREWAVRATGREPVLVMQATHSGRYSKPEGDPAPRIACRNPLFEKDMPLPDSCILSDDELRALPERYACSACLAEEAGFDGVDIKACHRYLLNELLSAHTRPGPYGGSFENRTRLLRDAVRAAKAATAGGAFITSRLNVYDGFPYPYGWGVLPDGGVEPELEEPKRLAALLVREEGVPLLNITIGNPYVNPHVNRPYDDGPYPPPEHPFAGVARLCRCVSEIKRAVPGAAVVASGLSYMRQFSGNLAAGMIAAGGADLAGFGRQAFAYPSFAADLLESGRLDPKKCCISCGKCSALMRAGSVAGCVVRDTETYLPYYRRDVGRVLKKAEENPHPKKEWAR